MKENPDRKKKNKVADELIQSLRSRYQGNFETSMRGTSFILIQFN